MDESATPAKTRPRFPWPVALLCAASLGVAAWTWMRYSYAWDAKPLHRMGLTHGMAYQGRFPNGAFCCRNDGENARYGRVVISDDSEDVWPRYVLTIRAASRLTWQSIGGLVVGAMGVFVFAVYLRTWVKGRREGGPMTELPTGQRLPGKPVGKYNEWCYRRAIVCSDRSVVRKAQKAASRPDLTAAEKAAHYLNTLVGCTGLELVLFSGARLESPTRLPGGVWLVPCFLNTLEGKMTEDPLMRATFAMLDTGRFVYDGWVPIEDWSDAGVRRAIRSIDESLSVLSIFANSAFEWKPKYGANAAVNASELLEQRHLGDASLLTEAIDKLHGPDRDAVYRSLGWLSQGLRLSLPQARFLCPILAVESLAAHIEDAAKDDSPLAALRADRSTKAERRERREKCIAEKLKEADGGNKGLTRIVQEAYLDCIYGIKRKLRAHLEGVLGPESNTVRLFFEGATPDGGEPIPSLYDLRHKVAHGTSSAVSEAERDYIQQRTRHAEQAARLYILAVLEKACGLKRPDGRIRVSVPISLGDVIVSSETMYQGPTHMALLYASGQAAGPLLLQGK